MPTPITVSVNFVDLTGSTVIGYMTAGVVSPTGVYDLYVSGRAIIAPKTQTSATGTSVSLALWGNDVIVDAADGVTDTYYTVNLFKAADNSLIWSAAYLFTGAGPINLVGFPILNPIPAPVPPSFPVVQPPGGSTGDVQFNNGGVFGGEPLVPLAHGGTNADLSATGGTSQVLKQVSSGAAITVAQLVASDLSNGTTGTGAVVLAGSPTLTGTPLAPTPVSTDTTTKIATTAFVTNSANDTGIVRSGLLAWYKMLPSETAAALVDYSGNGNNATGTVGSAPTIISVTGGVQFNANGAISLPAALNTALDFMFFVGYQSPSADNYNALFIGTDTSHTAGFILQNASLFNGAVNEYPRALATFSNGAFKSQSPQGFNGFGALEVAFDTADRFFLNGIETTYKVTGTSAGNQTTQNFQLGGGTAGVGAGAVTYWRGQIYYALVYNRILTAGERVQNTAAITKAMANRGIVLSNQFTGVTGDTLFCCGDSITFGNGISVAWPSIIVLNNSFTSINAGISGLQAAEVSPLKLTYSNIYVQPTAARNIVTVWLGTNDIAAGKTAAQTFAYNKQILNNLQSAGWDKRILVSMISADTRDTGKDALDPLFAANWQSIGATSYCDMANDPNLGADGAYLNTVYFQGDQIHPTQHAEYNNISPILQRAINRAYGNVNLTSATTYSSAGTIPATITSCSESGNTLSFTVSGGLDTRQFKVGAQIYVTGVTPSGYNGTWTILTANSTTVTAYNGTTGLTVGTLFGTIQAPLQQDADVFSILNFGTGSYPIESGLGYTGQRITIQNINGSSSTITAFGAELIDGSGTLTIQAASTVVLEWVANAYATGGGSWTVITS